MNLKFKAFSLALIVIISAIFYFNMNKEHNITPASATPSVIQQARTNYSSTITLDEKDLRLDHEVIQFTVLFHENDIINVTTLQMILRLGKDVEPQANMLILTNGSRSVFHKSNVSFLYYVPSALLFDATILGHRIAIGGRLFFNLLNLTRFRVGVAQALSSEISVKKGDVWYLTMSVVNPKPGEELRVVLRSLSMALSMELNQTVRSPDVGFYSALDNDFNGRYFGVKLPLLPFGFSFADNLQKKILTVRGSVVYFCSVGHRNGRMKIEAPNNKTYLNENGGLSVFSYCGNWAGTWNFTASGLGFPWKHNVMLFYADINPYLSQRI